MRSLLSGAIPPILLALCAFAASAAETEQHMFVFTTPVPANEVEARLHFCVRDARNAYYVGITRDGGSLGKIEDGAGIPDRRFSLKHRTCGW